MIWKTWGHLVIVNKVEHVLYGHFPENWRLWSGRGGVFYISVNMVLYIVETWWTVQYMSSPEQFSQTLSSLPKPSPVYSSLGLVSLSKWGANLCSARPSQFVYESWAFFSDLLPYDLAPTLSSATITDKATVVWGRAQCCQVREVDSKEHNLLPNKWHCLVTHSQAVLLLVSVKLLYNTTLIQVSQ